MPCLNEEQQAHLAQKAGCSYFVALLYYNGKAWLASRPYAVYSKLHSGSLVQIHIVGGRDCPANGRHAQLVQYLGRARKGKRLTVFGAQIYPWTWV